MPRLCFMFCRYCLKRSFKPPCGGSHYSHLHFTGGKTEAHGSFLPKETQLVLHKLILESRPFIFKDAASRVFHILWVVANFWVEELSTWIRKCTLVLAIHITHLYLYKNTCFPPKDIKQILIRKDSDIASHGLWFSMQLDAQICSEFFLWTTVFYIV